jgi:hypothetical protein
VGIGVALLSPPVVIVGEPVLLVGGRVALFAIVHTGARAARRRARRHGGIRAPGGRPRRLLPPDRAADPISTAVAINQQAAALAHELAHVLVRLERQPDNPQLSYATDELVAESVAFTVCGYLGPDTAGISIGYFAVWSEHIGADAFEQIAGLTDRYARRIEEALQDPDDATRPASAATVPTTA